MLKTVFQVAAGALVVLLGIALVSMFVEYRKQRSLPAGWAILRGPGEVSTILIRDDQIWTGGRDGISVIDPDTLEILPTPAGLADLRYVRAMQVDADGNIWIAHRSGVTRSVGANWRLISSEDLGLKGAVLSLLATPSGALWVGGEGGLVKRDAGGFHAVELPETSVIDSVTTIFHDNGGRLWIGSDSQLKGGLLSYSQQAGWQAYRVGAHLVHASVNGIVQDQTGRLWVATGFAGRGGVSLLENGVWTTPARGPEIDNRKVRSVYEDRAGRIWLGFEYDGVSVRAGDGWRQLRFCDGLAGEEGKVVRQDGNGTYWIGTSDGLSVIRRDAWVSVGLAIKPGQAGR